MLEFKKRILLKVSFDLFLFEKELKKALQWLSESDLGSLKSWCYVNFGERYTAILDKVFFGEEVTLA